MPSFISKLQYKTCEKGEYYDEKERTLEETIDLINNFPWAREQYADLDLTGPSITIKDKIGNYLKVGIYYGGRYSLYYLDSKNRLYQYRQLKMEKVHEKVAEFFDGKLHLQLFEKQPWRFRIRRVFVTVDFTYRVTLLYAISLCTDWFILFACCLGFLIFFILIKQGAVGLSLLIVPMFLLGRILAKTFRKYYLLRYQFIRISRGNNIFYFGTDENECNSYDKADILKIEQYVDKETRTPNVTEVFRIYFKDDTYITFTNVLITDTTLASKFSDKWKISPIRVEKGFFDMILLATEPNT